MAARAAAVAEADSVAKAAAAAGCLVADWRAAMPHAGAAAQDWARTKRGCEAMVVTHARLVLV